MTQVKIAEHPGLVGAGSVSLVLLVTNESFVDCTINGYPVVGLIDGEGARVGNALDSSRGPLGLSDTAHAPSALTLAPGQAVSALLGGSDMPKGSETACPSYSIAVQLPGSDTSTHFRGPVPGCSRVVVGPFVKGFNGVVPTGLVSGTAPRCAKLSATRSGLGETVQVTAKSGSLVVGAVTVHASQAWRQPYDVVLAPGRYQITAGRGLTRRVVVRVGRVTVLGVFGRCMPVPEQLPTTIPGREGPAPTTSTTTAITTLAMPQCANDQIGIGALRFGQAGGSASEVITFKNVGAAPCSLTGFPGVAVLNQSGEQVEQAARLRVAMMGGQFDGIELASVDLDPGQEASATVEGSDTPFGPETVCPYYPAFLITAPGQTRAVTLSAVGEQGRGFTNTGFPGCSRIVVTPVVPGDTGSFP